MSEQRTVQIKLLDPRFKSGSIPMPRYESAGAAGIDLRVMSKSQFLLKPNQCEVFPSGIAVFIEDPNEAAIVLPRSGLGTEGLILGNLTGLIDSDYQGQIMLPLWNRSSNPIVLRPGERVAQLVFTPITRTAFEVVDEFKASARGAKGFGSTGVQ